MEGIMMRGADRTAVVVRLPNNSLQIKTEKLPPRSKWMKFPVLRGVVAFVSALVTGTRTLMYSADVLESYEGEGATEYEDDKFSLWLEKTFGKDKAWNIMLYLSVVIAIIFTVGIFIILPTAAVNWCGKFVESEFALNLIEGVLRLVMFLIYVAAIRQMKDIRRVFGYHGAEHKCIHCYENGLELTPENCQGFYTLHPRCGTSFLMFVMVISILLFSCLGWPNLLYRILSRLLLIPVVAGLSYELLQWAGRADNWLVKVLSMPGIYLQKLTTYEPDTSQLEVAIAAMKAVMVTPDTPAYQGLCDLEGKPISETQEKDAEIFEEDADAKAKAKDNADAGVGFDSDSGAGSGSGSDESSEAQDEHVIGNSEEQSASKTQAH